MTSAVMRPAEILARAVGAEFYRRRLGRTPAWVEVSPTLRADLLRDQVEHPPLGTRHLPGAGTPVRVGTSGSGEDLLLLSWSEADLALERRAGTRLLSCLGIAPATAIANTLPGALASPGSLLFGDVVEEHGGLDVPLGAIESDAAAKQAWDLVDRVTPAILCLETATAERFFAAAPAAERPWIQGLLWLRRAGAPAAAPPVPRSAGFAGWQRLWLSVPEASSFAAVSCAAGKLHADERLVVELGEAGNLLLTPTDGASALLRYDTGLRARRIETCTCGGAGTAFDLVS